MAERFNGIVISSAGLAFPFEFQRRYRPLLALMGITPDTAAVRLDSNELTVHFGKLRFRTPVYNITGAELGGPYRAHRVIGARHSMSDGGAVMGTTTAGGVRLHFHHPISVLDPTGSYRSSALTLTLGNCSAFVRAVREAAGL